MKPDKETQPPSIKEEITEMFDDIEKPDRPTKVGSCQKCGSNAWQDSECLYCGAKITSH